MARSKPSAKSAARAKYKAAVKSSPPGGGGRFKAVEAEAAASGARNPAAVAAAVGRKKYGAKGMAKMAARGRKK
jgi:hypothetical protein